MDLDGLVVLEMLFPPHQFFPLYGLRIHTLLSPLCLVTTYSSFRMTLRWGMDAVSTTQSQNLRQDNLGLSVQTLFVFLLWENPTEF